MIRNLRYLLAFMTLFIGSLALLGWIIDLDILKSVLPGLATMKVNTALGFIAAGGALLVYDNRRLRVVGMVLALFVLLIGTLSALAYALNIDFGIDELFILDPDTPSERFPGRMSPGTAFNFVLIGIGLVLLYRPNWRVYSPYPALVANTLATIAALGYLYDIEALYDIDLFSSMAVNTAVAFLMAGNAILFAMPDNIIMRVLTAPDPGGKTARRILPFAIIIPALLGWLTIEAEQNGVLHGFAGQAILSTGVLLLLVCVVWWNAYILHTNNLKRQQMEASLASSERRFRTLFDKSPDVNFIVDQHTHTIVEVNNTISKTLGYTPDDVIGQRFTEIAGEGIGRQILENLQAGEVDYFNQTVKCATENACPVDLTVKIIPWDNAHAVLVTMRDIADRIELENRLTIEQSRRTELEREKELILLKEEFMAMVSHDFRTPLSVIMTSNGLMMQYSDRLSEERKAEHLKRIARQVDHMMELLDDVMVFIEGQTGKVSLALQQTDVVQVCQGVVEQVYFISKDTHELVFAPTEDVGMHQLDPKLVKRIIHNLLTNAVKYSPEGGEVRCEIRREPGALVFEISDQGIGIPEADQKRLFQAFRRAKNTGDIKGTGLGLAIVKQSVDIHNGEITFTSVENVGTTFIVRLPIPA